MCSITSILGLIGRNVNYSYSPFIHNTAAEMLRLPFYYTIFNIADARQIPDALNGMRALGIAGLNVTIPYKQVVTEYVDTLSAEAQAVGAVNTIVNNNGRLSGCNTDIAGVSHPLKPYKERLHQSPAGIFGNGGAALAAVEALRRDYHPSAIRLFVRDPDKGLALAEQVHAKHPEAPIEIFKIDAYDAIRDCHLLINATPIGTKGVQTAGNSALLPQEQKLLHDGQIIFDMVYNPLRTPFVNMAAEAGAVVIPGVEMLIAQAAESFCLWTGETMPVDSIREKLLKKLTAQP
ncbi:MAG: shikimate dehydrogenase [Prosthecochloris sp.]|uniref:shikimate dehydrogenase family protein n=1 Tax=unclassified Prosthecochloris TaxID=2632826 RepID=UPI000DF830B3|nr:MULTISPECIES: shikimate dehydrogenase [unclassified Prosthecochloris]MCW8798058.1 shikimate dehydrogenase [Prosthecochloris sp.]RDD29787.1 shikimate dehydrogenase [Prosthecochloris sp. ZM]